MKRLGYGLRWNIGKPGRPGLRIGRLEIIVCTMEGNKGLASLLPLAPLKIGIHFTPVLFVAVRESEKVPGE